MRRTAGLCPVPRRGGRQAQGFCTKGRPEQLHALRKTSGRVSLRLASSTVGCPAVSFGQEQWLEALAFRVPRRRAVQPSDQGGGHRDLFLRGSSRPRSVLGRIPAPAPSAGRGPARGQSGFRLMDQRALDKTQGGHRGDGRENKQQDDCRSVSPNPFRKPVHETFSSRRAAFRPADSAVVFTLIRKTRYRQAYRPRWTAPAPGV